jgi:hypothetical protein
VIKKAHLLLGVLFGQVLAQVFVTPSAFAYPHYIGYGYSSCLTCHYQPNGGGPLTDYGRAVAATTLAAKPFFVSSVTTDDDLAEHSGVVGKVDAMPDWLRAQGNYWGAWLLSSLENHPQKYWINMQAEGSLILQFFDDHHLYFVGTAGYIPPPLSLSPDQTSQVSTFISRELYGAYRWNLTDDKSLGLYVGFMDPSFGIHVPDHEAFLRSATFLNQNDQSHTIKLHYAGPKFEIQTQALFGNLYQDSTVRQKGATTMAEYEIAQNVRLGGSAWYSTSDFRKIVMQAVHTRIGLPEGNAVLAQVGLIENTPVGTAEQTQGYSFLQTQYRLARGLNLLTTYQYYTVDFFNTNSRIFQFGPTLQYLPFQRLELRVDITDSHQTGVDPASPDTYTFLGQVHLWL